MQLPQGKFKLDVRREFLSLRGVGHWKEQERFGHGTKPDSSRNVWMKLLFIWFVYS